MSTSFYRYTCFFCILLLVSLCANAQQKIQGWAFDSNHNLLPSTAVRIVNKENRVIASTLTNESGKYSLIVNNADDSLKVIASRLGYNTQERIFLYTSETNSERFDFVLSVKVHDLKEVIVRRKQAFTVAKDSTTFLASFYKDGSERTVEDVLQKLPGILVLPNGTITFKGKPIEKLTIEGEDFFSTNYKLITKNMPQNAIEKVDLIENYNENRLLKGITKSDKTIINLRIREDAKNIPFGTIKAGLTFNNKYEFNNTLFLIKQKSKLGQLSNLNTVNFDPVSEVESSLQTTNQAYRGLFDTNPTITGLSESVPTPSIPTSRYTVNRARMGAITLSKVLAPTLKTRAWIYGYGDNLTQAFTNNLSILHAATVAEWTEQTSFIRNPNLIKGQFDIDFNPNETSNLAIQLSGSSFKPSTSLTINSPDVLIRNASTAYKEALNNSTLNIDYSKKIQKNKVWQLNTFYSYKNFHSDYIANSKLYEQVGVNIPSKGSLSLQNLYHQQIDFVLKSKYIVKSKSVLQTYSISYNQSTQPFKSTIDSSSTKELVDTASVFYTNLNYKKNFLSSEASLNWDINKWQLYFGGYQQIGFLTNQEMHKSESMKFFLTSNFFAGIKYSINTSSVLNVNFTSITALPNVNNLANGYRFLNYRTLQRGADSIVIRRDNAVLLTYTLTDPVRFLTISANVIASITNNPSILFNTFQANLSLLELKPVNIHTKAIQSTISFDKYVHELRTRINFVGSLSMIDGLLGYNTNKIGLNKNTSFNYKLSMSSAFTLPINGEIGSQLSRNDIEISREDIYTQYLSNNSFFGLIRYNNKNNTLKANFKIERVTIQNNEYASKLWFGDFWLLFSPQNKFYSIELVGRNIFNAVSLTTLNLVNTFVTRSTFNLIRPMFEVKLEYRLGI